MNRGQILVLPVDQQFFIVGKVLDLVQTETELLNGSLERFGILANLQE